MNSFQEVEEEVQVNLEEQRKKDLMQKEEKEMGAQMDIKKDKDHSIIIITNLVSLVKISMNN